MCNNPREYTTRLFDAMEAGVISADSIALMALQYMSEDDVADMCRANDIAEFLEAL